jgi:alpha-L-fucosidase 2
MTARIFASMAMAATLPSLALAQFPAAANDANELLWYQKPAAQWIEALPIGNGRLGAMVFGQPEHDRLQLNDVTVWSGNPQPDADRKDAWKHLPEIRKAAREGRYNDAERLCKEFFTGPAPYNNSYQTLGDLTLDFTLPQGEVADYRRWLDIGRAVAGVEFTAGGVKFQREIFSSAPAGVIALRIAADAPGRVSFRMKLSRGQRAQTHCTAPDMLVMTGDTGDTLEFEARARVLTKGGHVKGEGEVISVEGADEAVVLLTAATNYALDYDKGFKGGDLALAGKRMSAAAARSFAELEASHIADYQRYFRRLKIDLGPAKTTLPTDERLRDYGQGQADPGFAALFYQFGRYLLISSSRPDNPLPSNSQGLWGDGFDLPWKCDYKSNINYEMNYWSAEPANLSEMHLPMLRMTRELVKPGTKTARAYFGPATPGWVVGYTTNGWGWTSPGAGLPWGVWFGGSAWMCQHLWEHYAFTRDKNYLRAAYPILKGAAEFWLANLVTGPDGRLITSPSTSPENNFTTDTGMTSTVTEGATMERSIVWDLFDNTAKAAAELGDDAFSRKVQAARDQIEPLRVGKLGQLMEWNGDWDGNARDMEHRHVSHLFALHPGHQISPLTTPKLADAAKKTLAMRGDDGTGWSLAWKINFWARLRDGDHAFKLMSNQLRATENVNTVMQHAGGTYPNLFDAHPPFQIDGNFGFVSGVSEMLLQSQERYTDPFAPKEDRYYIDLLPALPSAWPNGSIFGLRARGGFTVDLTWKAGKLVAARLRSDTGGATRVRYAGRALDVRLEPGQSIALDCGLKPTFGS